jgi:hypothetical protein
MMKMQRRRKTDSDLQSLRLLAKGKELNVSKCCSTEKSCPGPIISRQKSTLAPSHIYDFFSN